MKPGESSSIKATFNSGGYSGKVTKAVYVYTNDPKNSEVVLMINADVEQATTGKIVRLLYRRKLLTSSEYKSESSFTRKEGKRRKNYSVDEYVEGILNRQPTILSQAITLVESSLREHYDTAQVIIEKCLPYSAKSLRIGITGVPGAGKSTFIETFGMYLTGLGRKLAVLTIDPSSGQTKGSILGDKTRMEQLSVHPYAYIRPSPSAGTLGGVARKTRETIILCEAAGFDTILVETVGVGQSETEVHSMVDLFLLLMLAGAGDETSGNETGNYGDG